MAVSGGSSFGNSYSTSLSQSSSRSGVDLNVKKLIDDQYDKSIVQANHLGTALGQGYDSALGLQALQGLYARSQINRDFDAQRNSVGSQLAGTGLYNSTVMGNMKQGVERERQASLLANEESVRKGLIDVLLSKLGSQQEVGLTAADLYGRKASTLPTYSVSNSLSGSTSKSSNSSSNFSRS